MRIQLQQIDLVNRRVKKSGRSIALQYINGGKVECRARAQVVANLNRD